VPMVLSLSRERVRVSPKLVGSCPNATRNTQHDGMCTIFGGEFNTNAATTTHKGS